MNNGKEIEVKAEDYIVISAFMIHNLKLKGTKLLAYAMIYGFSRNEGGCFWGSVPWLASWLQTSVEGTRTAIKELEQDGLIKQIGKHRQGSHETRKYVINQELVDAALSSEEPQASDQEESSPQKIVGEETSPQKTGGDHPKIFGSSPQKSEGDYISNNINNNQSDSLSPLYPQSEVKESAIQEIANHFVEKTGKRLKSGEDVLIAGWLSHGYTVEDCKRVIDVKSSQWLDDPKMHKWVRIETLFGDKFPGYTKEPLPVEVRYSEYQL